MTFIPDLTQKRCFTPCPKSVVDSGMCSCQNKLYNLLFIEPITNIQNTKVMKTLKVKKINPEAILPTYATEGSAGFDLYSVDELVLEPGKRALVDTGLAFEIPEGFEIQIRPRSGLAFKHGVTVLNSPGTVDADFRGQVKVILHNTDTENSVKINVGDRIAQGVLAMVTDHVNFVEITEFSAQTARGEGGFGSTGVN